jgi:D-inositol-3-phosphate glycosyltransferase
MDASPAKASSDPSSPFVIGTIYLPPTRPSGDPVYGADVAINGALRALRDHSRCQRIEAFSPPHLVYGIAEAFAARSAGGQKLRFHGEQVLLNGIDAFGVDVWHQTDTYFRVPFHLRAAYSSRLYPVTFMVHCQSPQPFLHEFYLPLLIDDVQPCDSFVCTTHAARQATERLLAHIKEDFDRIHGTNLTYRGRIDVVPLGIDTERFKPGDKPALRASLGLPLEDFTILWHGRLSAADKADLLPLLRVFQRLVEANPRRSLRLVIAGSDLPGFPFAPSLKNAASEMGIADHVTFLVGFPPDRSQDLYAAADVFVSPIDNIQETFGLTPVEAMACGVPQVVSEWDGYRETVRHEETGFLVPSYWTHCDADLVRATRIPASQPLDVGFPHFILGQSVVLDLECYQKYLQALIDNEDLRQRMSRASRQRAMECFSWPVFVRHMEALWDELREVARRTPFPPVEARPRRYHQPRYVETFSGYASRMLSPEAVLRITRTGREVLAGKASLPNNYGPLDLLAFEPFAMRQALVALETAGEAGRTLGSLAQELMPGTLDRATRHLLRLAKHGLASFSPGAESR